MKTSSSICPFGLKAQIVFSSFEQDFTQHCICTFVRKRSIFDSLAAGWNITKSGRFSKFGSYPLIFSSQVFIQRTEKLITICEERKSGPGNKLAIIVTIVTCSSFILCIIAVYSNSFDSFSEKVKYSSVGVPFSGWKV